MTDCRHFDEIGGNDDDRKACIQGFEEQTIDLTLRADVNAGGGVLQNEKLALEVEPSAEHDLLLVTAGQVFDQRLRVIRAELDEAAQSARGPTLCCRTDRRQDRLVLDAMIEEQVFRDGKALHDRFRAPIAAGEPQTES